MESIVKVIDLQIPWQEKQSIEQAEMWHGDIFFLTVFGNNWKLSYVASKKMRLFCPLYKEIVYCAKQQAERLSGQLRGTWSLCGVGGNVFLSKFKFRSIIYYPPSPERLNILLLLSLLSPSTCPCFGPRASAQTHPFPSKPLCSVSQSLSPTSKYRSSNYLCQPKPKG